MLINTGVCCLPLIFCAQLIFGRAEVSANGDCEKCSSRLLAVCVFFLVLSLRFACETNALETQYFFVVYFCFIPGIVYWYFCNMFWEGDGDEPSIYFSRVCRMYSRLWGVFVEVADVPGSR